MTFELWTLVAMGFYLMVLGHVAGYAKIKQNDVLAQKNFNRDNLNPVTGNGARAQRAIDNLYENLPGFVIVVLLVHITGSYNKMTYWGAMVFLVARLLHPVFYILGLAYLRSTMYLAGLRGIILMAWQLV